MSVAHALGDRRPQGLGAPSLSVGRLRLRNFRNYAALDLGTDPAPVVLTGENGAGKTNLLEALSLLTPGRGLRRARLPELDRTGNGPFAVEASLEGRLGGFDIATSAADGRRQVSVDDRLLRGHNDLADLVSLVWLTPAMDRLFQESPAGRRRFVDRLVLSIYPDHARQVGAFERAMRERSTLLRQDRHDPAWLKVLEQRIVEAGVAVAAARGELIRALGGRLAEAALPFPHPRLRLDGDVESWLDQMPALEVEARYAAILAAERHADALTGGASVGPHRTDLLAVDAWTGEPAATCSTGRQKALLASVIIAQARLRLERMGELPVLLLDELAAHLDWRRRRELLEVLLDLGAQTWMTGTDVDFFRGLRGRAQFIAVSNGTLVHHE